jgi:hypothetical protein
MGPAKAIKRVPHFWPILPEVGIFDRAKPKGRDFDFLTHPDPKPHSTVLATPQRAKLKWSTRFRCQQFSLSSEHNGLSFP